MSVTPSSTSASAKGKLPRPIFELVYSFPPNRDTMGGTAYLILGNTGNVLIDCPAENEQIWEFLHNQGGVRWLVLTHRGGHGKVAALQQAFQCEIVVQEQEAYLLPGLTVTSFEQEFPVTDTVRVFWTPGHSPGSACVFYNRYGGILFTGRHLLPNRKGAPEPLRIAKTFHWPRQLQQVERILNEFSSETLQWICPGANTGFLRGEAAIADAYTQLAQLNLQQLRTQTPLL
ncbi:MAG: MBL fold metallo-hydrolase [Thainema sp.]